MVRKKPVKKKTKNVIIKPWEPDAKQMEWYRLWTEDMESYAEIGRISKPPVCRQTIMVSVHKTEEWIRLQSYDKVLRFRGRQTAALEKIITDCLRAFKRSIGRHVITTTKTSVPEAEHWDDGTQKEVDPTSETTVKVEELNGTPAFISEARGAMADIRKIWGIDTPTKSSLELKNNANEVDGIPNPQDYETREEFLLATAQAIEEMAALEKSTHG